MYNCLFDDTDLNIKVRLKGFIHKNQKHYGYFLKLIIYKKDVVPLMQNNIIPMYDSSNFILPVDIISSSLLTINGIRLKRFIDHDLDILEKSNPIPKYIYLKRHSKNSRKKNPNLISDYYASKARFNMPHNTRKERTLWS